MKLNTIALAAAIAASIALCGCKRHADFQGTWTATAPTDLTALIPSAASASSLLTVSFIDTPDTNGGPVRLSSILNITQQVEPSGLINEPYEVSIAATASVAGRWAYKSNDRDELLLTFDPESLDINVDSNGVTYSQNLLTGAQQPEIDSLTVATVKAWNREIKHAVTADLGRFNYLDDVEVHQKNSVLSFEVQNPKQELHFLRSE